MKDEGKTRKRLNITDWYVPDCARDIENKIVPMVQAAAAEVIDIAISENYFRPNLVSAWPEDYDESKDPLIIDVELSGMHTSDQEDVLICAASIRDLVHDFLPDVRVDADFRLNFTKIRDALRALANDIDEALSHSAN